MASVALPSCDSPFVLTHIRHGCPDLTTLRYSPQRALEGDDGSLELDAARRHEQQDCYDRDCHHPTTNQHAEAIATLARQRGSERRLGTRRSVERAQPQRNEPERSHLGYDIVGFVDDDGRRKGTNCGGLPVFGTYSDIPAVSKKESVEALIISEVSNSPNEIMRIIEYSADIRATIYMVPSLMDIITGHLKTNQVFGVPLMVLLQDHMPGWEAQIKRLMDIGVSLAVLVLGAPLWLLVAALVRATSSGPAVFRQERIGRNGKPFIMMKYRSMYEDAEKHTGPTWATDNDPRITPIGRFLRKTRLDEIPQFLNVLKGEMSLVGPRPERAFFVEQLKKEIPWYVRRIKMKPGITGWAQVKHKYDASIEDVKQKVMYDLHYFENMSIMLDLKIILRTILVVFTGKGAH